ncbi:MAG: hypothetical protein MRY72_01020 [Aquisalinus sp.]|nr:hypothetical protein [Aquisalinus sp.]
MASYLKNLIFCLIFFLPITPSSFANDPFDSLFGIISEPLEVSYEEGPSKDDVMIVEAKLNNLAISDDISLYRLGDSYCVPIMQFMEVVEFPFDEEVGAISGWAISPDRHFRFDFEGLTASYGARKIQHDNFIFQSTSEGRCVGLASIEELFPLTLSVNLRNLSLQIISSEILPIEARLERARYRREMVQRRKPQRAEYPYVEEDYKAFSLPTFDFGANLGIGPSTISADMALAVTTDILWMTGDIRTIMGRGTIQDNLRVTLSRFNENRTERLFATTRISIGDIASQDIPLLAKSEQGRGIYLSNRPLVASEVFDLTTVRGRLPPGWEAELYSSDKLVDFITAPNDLGEYEFNEVPLLPGYNRFTVKLYGPHGEEEIYTHKFFVGADMNAENEVQFDIGFIEPGKFLFTRSKMRAQSENTQKDNRPISAYFRLRRGLTKNLSAGLSAFWDTLTQTASASVELNTSFYGIYNSTKIAAHETGKPAVSTALQGRAGSNSSYFVRFTTAGDLENTATGFGETRSIESGQFRFDTNTTVLGHPITYRIGTNWQKLASGLEDISVGARLSTTLRGTSLSTSLRNDRIKDKAGSQKEAYSGKILASRAIGKTRLRSELAYLYEDGFRLSSAEISGQRRLKSDWVSRFSVSQDMRSGSTTVSTGLSKSYETYSMSLSAQADDLGDWNVNFGFSFSLFENSSSKYEMGPPGLSRTGALNVSVFNDFNADGELDPTDEPIHGAAFLVADSLRRESTDQSGQVLFGKIEPFRQTNLELQLASLDDPFLRPEILGRTVRTRPGKIIDIEIPLMATGDIDGAVMVETSTGVQTLAGITVDIFTDTGLLVASAVTEYDGYFYAEDLPAQTLFLRVSKADLALLGAESTEVIAELSRDIPSVAGLDLLIKMPKK